MNKIMITVMAIGLAATMASCSKKNDNTSPSKAHVMFVNACINTTTLEANVDGTNVSNATNLAFLKNSGYQDVATGNVTVKFLIPTTSTNLTSTTYNFTANNNYTVFASGLINTASIVVASDDMTGPSSGHAKVRFVNLSADSSVENAYVGNTTIDSAAGINAVSNYKEVPAGNAQILVQNTNNPTQLVTLSQSFNDGKIYTIVYTGIASGSSGAQPTVTIINNN